ncbi:uncharacterized protein LOC135396524 isoform X2 [Ornithodoros turicata]
MFTVHSIQNFLLDILVEYCLFLPLDVWTKYAIRAHRSHAESCSHIWFSEAQILGVLCGLLMVWRGSIPWLLLLLTCGAYYSSAPSTLTSSLAWAWLQGMASLGAALDAFFLQVFPRSQWGEAELCSLGNNLCNAVKGVTTSLGKAAAWAWASLGRWHKDFWDGYEHHADSMSHTLLQAPEASQVMPTTAGKGSILNIWPQYGPEESTPLSAARL